MNPEQLRKISEELYWTIFNHRDPDRSEQQIDWVAEYLQEKLCLDAEPSREILLKMLEGKDKTLKNRNTKIRELQKEVNSLKKQMGIQEDGFIDTPSLNIIRFVPINEFFDMRPYCSKHGAMKCFDHKIYRCIECGVVISLEGMMVIPSGVQGKPP